MGRAGRLWSGQDRHSAGVANREIAGVVEGIFRGAVRARTAGNDWLKARSHKSKFGGRGGKMGGEEDGALKGRRYVRGRDESRPYRGKFEERAGLQDGQRRGGSAGMREESKTGFCQCGKRR